MATTKNESQLTITAPDIRTIEFRIIGTAPYVQLRFAEKAINLMREKHELGPQAKKGAKKEARDFDEDFLNALYTGTKGGRGIPASAFRNALISACRIVGFQMTKAKLGVFVQADDLDPVEGTPLVNIEGEPEMVVHHVRNATGVADLRVRGMWKEWAANVRVQYDNDMFSAQDVANLFLRVGMQVGIGEGRPDGKQSGGMGWGTFRLED